MRKPNFLQKTTPLHMANPPAKNIFHVNCIFIFHFTRLTFLNIFLPQQSQQEKKENEKSCSLTRDGNRRRRFSIITVVVVNRKRNEM